MSAWHIRNEKQRCFNQCVFALFLANGLGFGVIQGDEFGSELGGFNVEFKMTDASLEIEGKKEQRSRFGSSETQVQERLSIVPTVGVEVLGSYIHPNFLEFKLIGDLGYRDESISLTGIPLPGDSSSTNSLSFQQKFKFNLSALKEKPYATSLFLHKGVAHRDRDFFSRVKVDSLNFGFQTGYRAGPIPFGLRFSKTKENESDSRQGRGRDETRLSIDAKNSRDSGGTTEFSFSYLDFTRRNLGIAIDVGSQRAFELSNTETFGGDKQNQLRNSLRYVDFKTARRQSDNLNVRNSLRVEHSESLKSEYFYNFGLLKNDGSEMLSYTGRASLTHQLFESLTSACDIHFVSNDSTAEGFRSRNNRVGIRLNESYTKRLGESSRLSLSYTTLYDEEDRLNRGGGLNIVDEAKTINDGGIRFLDNPLIEVETVTVTDETGSIIYHELIDYVLIDHGQLIEIRRVPGGAISDGSSILVSYRAEDDESRSFSTLSRNASFRLDVFDGRFAIFWRRSIVDNFGGEDIFLRDIKQNIIGSELAWGVLGLRGEQERFLSNISPFRTNRLIRSVAFHPMPRLSLGIDASKESTHLLDEDSSFRSDRIVGKVKYRFNRYFLFNMEGGYQKQQGDRVNQYSSVARVRMSFQMRQLKVDMSYEYQDESFFSRLFERNSFSFQARRVF